MTKGSSDDIQNRLWRLIPKRWFAWKPPNYAALTGGLSDLASWCHGWTVYAKAQSRLATAYGIWLDILAYDFLRRQLMRNGSQDDAFRALIRVTILQERVTRAGMISALTTITGKVPWVFEPWNSYDTGAYSSRAKGKKYGSMGYGVGRGGYGNMRLPGQVFLHVYRSASSGVPGVAGYGSSIGGYGVGRIEYIGRNTVLTGVTNEIIYQVINQTKPTGSTCWVAIG